MRPGSEAELAEAVRGAEGPVRIVGGGTRAVGDCAGAVLEVSGLAGVTLYEPGALTLVAGAGTSVAEVETVLAGAGQRLGFEVPDLRGLLARAGASTLGGVVAANASGPRRVQGGACRDALLGVRFVDGRGDVIRNGGRVMKNVTGYDLVKLMAGSWGVLGVLTEVAFRVQAVPEAEATLVGRGGVAALTKALTSPYDVSGAAVSAGATLIRVEGLVGSVGYRVQALRAAMGGEWDVIEGAASVARWREVRDVAPFAGRPGAIWRCAVTPSGADGVVAGLAEWAPEVVLDWGGGLVWLLVDEAADVRGVVAQVGGHATCLRGTAPAFPPEAAAVAALSRGLRAQFDPRGIFNAGLMG